MASFSFTKTMDHIHYRDIPKECIEECSAGGRDADPHVKIWREKLGFMVDREAALNYIRSTGVGFADNELESKYTSELSEWILWSMCCTFREFMAWRKNNPGKSARLASYGSDVFTLEN